TLIDHNVADIDAGTDLNALIFRNVDIAGRHAPLDFHGAKHSVDCACKFDQQAIPRGFDDTAAMLGNSWINEIAAVRLQRGKCSFLIVAHKAAVASYICGEDGS